MRNGLFHLSGRATEASARTVHEQMETSRSDDGFCSTCFSVSQNDRSVARNAPVLLWNKIMFWVGACFFEKRHAKTTSRSAMRKHHFRLGTWGALRFSVFQNDGSVARNAPFLFSNKIFWFWSELVSSRSAMRKHHFRLGTRGALRFSVSQNDGSVARNAPFLFSSKIFWFWSERVSWRSATRNTLFLVFFPLGTS